MLQANYGADVSLEKWELLLNYFRAAGWTKKQLHAARTRILQNNKFGTWTIADWVQAGEVRFYSYQWYREQTTKDPTLSEKIGCYAVPVDEDVSKARSGAGYRGRPVWGWKSELDGVLPRYKMPTKIPDLLPVASIPLLPETVADIDQTKKIIELLNEVEDLRKLRDRLVSDNASLQKAAEELTARARHYKDAAEYLSERLEEVSAELEEKKKRPKPKRKGKINVSANTDKKGSGGNEGRESPTTARNRIRSRIDRARGERDTKDGNREDS